MPLISEDDYLLFARAINDPLATPQDVNTFAQKMRQYEDQQKELNLELTPKLTADADMIRKQREQTLDSMFDGGIINVPYDAPDNVTVAPEAKAKRALSVLFENSYPDFNYEFYDNYKADYIQKNFTPEEYPKNDIALYDLVYKKRKAEKSYKKKAEENYKFALETIGNAEDSDVAISRLSREKMEIFDSPLYKSSYEALQKILTPYNEDKNRFLSAVRRKMTEGATPDDEKAINSFRDKLLEMPEQHRDLVLMSALGEAKKTGLEKAKLNTFLQEFADSFGRIYTEGAEGIGALRAETIISKVKTNGSVSTTIPEIKSMADARKYVEEQTLQGFREFSASRGETVGAGTGVAIPIEGAVERQLTADEKVYISQAIKERMKPIEVGRRLNQIGTSIDPIRDTWEGLFASTLGSSAAVMVPLFSGIAGGTLVNEMYKGMEYNKVRLEYPDMPPQQAEALATVSSGLQLAADYLNVSFIKRIPGLARVIEKTSTSTTNKLLKATGAMVGGYAFENTIEGVQDATTPVVQWVFSQFDEAMPDVDLSKARQEWLDTRADVAIGMIPLTVLLGGAGVGAKYVSDRAVLKIAVNDEMLLDAGIIEEDRQTLLKLAEEKNVDEIRRLFPEMKNRISKTQVEQRKVQKLVNVFQTNQAANHLNNAIRAGIIPNFQVLEDGSYSVEDANAPDGQPLNFKSQEELMSYLETRISENDRRVGRIALGESENLQEDVNKTNVSSDLNVMNEQNDTKSRLRGLGENVIAETNKIFGDPVEQNNAFKKLVENIFKGKKTAEKALNDYVSTIYRNLPRETKAALGPDTKSGRDALMRLVKNLADKPIQRIDTRELMALAPSSEKNTVSKIEGFRWRTQNFNASNKLSDVQKNALGWLQDSVSKRNPNLQVVLASPEIDATSGAETYEAGIKNSQWMSALNDIFGVNIQFFDSKQGQDVGVQGFFDSNSMTVFVNVRQPKNNAFAYVIGHEFSHFLKRLDPSLYENIKNVILGMFGKNSFAVEDYSRNLPDEAYFSKNGIPKNVWFSSTSADRNENLKKLGYAQSTIDRVNEQITDEFISDYMGGEFVGGKLMKELYNQDQETFGKLVTWFQGFIRFLKQKLNNIFSSVDVKNILEEDLESTRIEIARTIKKYADLTKDKGFARQWYSFYGRNLSAFFLNDGFRNQIKTEYNRVLDQGGINIAYKTVVRNGKSVSVPFYVGPKGPISITPANLPAEFRVIETLLAFKSPEAVKMNGESVSFEYDEITASIEDIKVPTLTLTLPDGRTLNLDLTEDARISNEMYENLTKLLELSEEKLRDVRKNVLNSLSKKSKDLLTETGDEDRSLMVRDGNIEFSKDESIINELLLNLETYDFYNEFEPEIRQSIFNSINGKTSTFDADLDVATRAIPVNILFNYKDALNVNTVENTASYMKYVLTTIYNSGYAAQIGVTANNQLDLKTASYADLKKESSRLVNAVLAINPKIATQLDDVKQKFVDAFINTFNIRPEEIDFFNRLTDAQIKLLESRVASLKNHYNLNKSRYGNEPEPVLQIMIPDFGKTDPSGKKLLTHYNWLKLSNEIFGVNTLIVTSSSKLQTDAIGSQYSSTTNTIVLNPYAGESTFFYLFGHEFLHRIQKNNPTIYSTIKDIIFAATTPTERNNFYSTIHELYFTPQDVYQQWSDETDPVKKAQLYNDMFSRKQKFVITPEADRRKAPEFNPSILSYNNEPDIVSAVEAEFVADMIGRRFLDQDFIRAIIDVNAAKAGEFLNLLSEAFKKFKPTILNYINTTKLELAGIYLSPTRFSSSQERVIESIIRSMGSKVVALDQALTAQIKLFNQSINPSTIKAGGTMLFVPADPKGPLITNKSLAESINEMENLDTGTAIDVLSHPDIGKISLIWGYANENISDSFGLAKIKKFYPEIDLNKLQELFNNAEVIETENMRKGNRESFVLRTPEGIRLVVRKDFNGEPMLWLVSAFDETLNPETTAEQESRDIAGTEPIASLPKTTVETTPAQASNVQFDAQIQHIAGKIRNTLAAAQTAALQGKERVSTGEAETVETAIAQIIAPVDQTSFQEAINERRERLKPKANGALSNFYKIIKSRLRSALLNDNYSVNALTDAETMLMSGKTFEQINNLSKEEKRAFIQEAYNNIEEFIRQSSLTAIENNVNELEAIKNKSKSPHIILRAIVDAFRSTKPAEDASALFNKLYTPNGVPKVGSTQEYFDDLIRYNILKIVGNYKQKSSSELENTMDVLNDLIKKLNKGELETDFYKNMIKTLTNVQIEAQNSVHLDKAEAKLHESLHGEKKAKGVKKIFQPLLDMLKPYGESHLTFASLLELVFPNTNGDAKKTYNRIAEIRKALSGSLSEEEKSNLESELIVLSNSLGKAITPEMQKVSDDIFTAYNNVLAENENSEYNLRKTIARIFGLKKSSSFQVNKVLYSLMDRSQGFTVKIKNKKYEMSQAYAGYILNVAETEKYGAQLTDAGFTPEVLVEIRKNISDEANELRKELRKEIAKEYQKVILNTKELFGHELPKPTDSFFPVQYKQAGTAVVDAFDIHFQGGLTDKDAQDFISLEGKDLEFDLNDQMINMLTMFNSFMFQSIHKRNVTGPITTAKAILVDKTVSDKITSAFGSDFYEQIYKQLNSLETNGIRTNEISRRFRRFLRGLMGGVSRGALGFNPSTILLNALSAGNTLLDSSISMKQALISYSKAFAALIGAQTASKIETKRFDLIKLRSKLGANSLISMNKTEPLFESPTVLTEVADYSMIPMSKMDAFAGNLAAMAAYDAHYTMAKKAGLSDAEAEEAANLGVNRTINKTFQPNVIAGKALVEMSSNPFVRMLTMFLSEARKSIGLEITAYKKMRAGLGRGDFMRILAVNHIIIGGLAFFIRAAIKDALSDEEEDEEIWSATSLFINLVMGPLNGALIFGSGLEMALNKIVNSAIDAFDLKDEEVAGLTVKKTKIFPKDNIIVQTVNNIGQIQKLTDEDAVLSEKVDAFNNAGKAMAALLNNTQLGGAIQLSTATKKLIDLIDEQAVDVMEEPEK